MLVDNIDEDKDGFVTTEEMKEWLTDVQRRWIYKNVDRQWEMFDINGDDLVSWEEYRDITYGNIVGKNLQPEIKSQVQTPPMLKLHMFNRRRQNRRWLKLQRDDGAQREEVQDRTGTKMPTKKSLPPSFIPSILSTWKHHGACE